MTTLGDTNPLAGVRLDASHYERLQVDYDLLRAELDAERRTTAELRRQLDEEKSMRWQQESGGR